MDFRQFVEKIADETGNTDILTPRVKNWLTAMSKTADSDPICSFLMKNITSQNLLTLDEKRRYDRLAEKNAMTDKEVDEKLAKYFKDRNPLPLPLEERIDMKREHQHKNILSIINEDDGECKSLVQEELLKRGIIENLLKDIEDENEEIEKLAQTIRQNVAILNVEVTGKFGEEMEKVLMSFSEMLNRVERLKNVDGYNLTPSDKVLLRKLADLEYQCDIQNVKLEMKPHETELLGPELVEFRCLKAETKRDMLKRYENDLQPGAGEVYSRIIVEEAYQACGSLAIFMVYADSFFAKFNSLRELQQRVAVSTREYLQASEAELADLKEIYENFKGENVPKEEFRARFFELMTCDGVEGLRASEREMLDKMCVELEKMHKVWNETKVSLKAAKEALFNGPCGQCFWRPGDGENQVVKDAKLCRRFYEKKCEYLKEAEKNYKMVRNDEEKGTTIGKVRTLGLYFLTNPKKCEEHCAQIMEELKKLRKLAKSQGQFSTFGTFGESSNNTRWGRDF